VTKTKKISTLKHLESGAKYAGSSVVLASAVTGIITFYYPEAKEIDQNIVALLTFVFNLLAIYIIKKDV
jgi:hypothetical protein